ncbi:drug/metabolite transporter (DMT)-like permease [Litorimonas taeanensis]|uniref:Drug/metabolite transporter (DMT)-like permease n=1 Tax=Litorimonas taeanensis TaxID=568099 RepID=A0A420WL57_9PROT|nr:EamA family transporter [Litorimonas taeanensis]RKQ71781.1 drug/metabolite transporter (DMT)-like permease [Litorimonas taeanensis]
MNRSIESTTTESISLQKLAVFAIILILIWGSAFTMVSVAVRYIAPIWMVAFRLTFGAIFLTAYMLIRGHRFPPLKDKRWIWYSALGLTSSVIPFFLLGTGMETVDSGLTAILVGCMPLMTIIMAHFVTEEKLNFLKLIGFIIGLFGTVILFLPDDFSFRLIQDWQAQLLIILAAFFYALTTVAAKIAPKTSSTVAAAMMMITGAAFGLAAALFTGLEGAIPPDGNGLVTFLMISGLGLGSSGIAVIMYLYFIDVAGTSSMASVNYFVPIASVGFGVWLLHEPLSWRIFASFAVILLGVLIARLGKDKPPMGTPNPNLGR